jgi:hypothetical protein
LQDEWFRNPILVVIVAWQIEAKDVPGAQKTVNAISNAQPGWFLPGKLDALRAIAATQAKSGDKAEALATTMMIVDAAEKANVLGEIVEAVPPAVRIRRLASC